MEGVSDKWKEGWMVRERRGEGGREIGREEVGREGGLEGGNECGRVEGG